MITQRLVWTLLPNGLRGASRARASVLVSPRLTLTPDEAPFNLSKFPAFLDWPSTLANANFRVQVNGGATVNASVVSAPDDSVWKAMFPATTFVRPWAFDAAGLRNKVVLSYPVAHVAALIETLYGETALSAQEKLPKRRDLAQVVVGRPPGAAAGRGVGGVRPKPLAPREVLDRLRGEQQRIREAARSGAARSLAGFGLMGDPTQALDLLQAYHTPLQSPQTGSYKPNEQPDGYAAKFPGKPNPMRHAMWETHKRAPLAKPADFKNLIDFHQIVAALCQYPELNRLCGLVVELEFDRPPQGAAITLQLLPPLAPANPSDVFPRIVVNNVGATFCAAKRSPASPIVDRYLRLSDQDYGLFQMDVDGAGMKVKNLRESLTRELPEEFDEDEFEDVEDKRDQPKVEPDAGLPALRTGGLMLAERRRDLSLAGLFQNAASMQTALESAAATPTLYAEDIIRGYRIDVLDREVGRWRSLFFRKTDFRFKNTGGVHQTPREEGMARLAASGSADDSNTDIIKIHEGLASWTGWSLAAPEPGRLIRADEEGLPPVREESEETPPGLPLETKYSTVPGTLPRLRFGRTYAMRARLVDLAGASEEFIESSAHPNGAQTSWATFRRHEPIEPPGLALVRQGGVVDPVHDGESMQRIALRSWNDTTEKNTIPTEQVVRRHGVPTRVGHRFAELHGAMDTGPGGSIDPSLYGLLTAKDQPLAEIAIDRGKSAATAKPERYAYADAEFDLPYIPDPLAIGVAIRVVGADGVDPAKIHNFRLYPAGARWPHAAPFKIVAGEFAMPDAKFDEASREFRIPMKKAERARVFISSILPRGAIGMMAVREMIQKRNPTPAVIAAVEQRIASGQHWMFTPRRMVEVVHAVQKPLIAPVMLNLTIGRDLGDAAARPGIESLPLHAKSTARVDMDGEWQEPVDDPGDLQAAAAPYSRREHAHAFSKKIARNATPDNRYRYFTGRHVFSNTSYRRVAYTLHATSRYKEFFAPEIRNDESQLKVTSSKRVGWVPNAAPPPPPKVLYVIPTFGWARSSASDRATSLRAGGGLRIYLDRPWMTTGFTEMLGVVLPHISSGHPVSPTKADSEYAGSVTMWGADPIWTSTSKILDASPPLNAFPLARTSGPITFEGSGLPAEEGTDLPPGAFRHTGLPHPQVMDDDQPYANRILLDVAPHVVGYDAQRQLWYSDIVIRPPSGQYYPFVRLALARYNPISVNRAHLSTMAITEFQQLAADRLAIVTKGAGSAKISVHGTAADSVAGPSIGERFEVLIQTLASGADPDLDWRTVAEPPPPAGLSLGSRAGAAVVQGPGSIFAPTPAQRLEAERALQSADVRALTARPDLALALQPPLIWQKEVRLPPAPSGGKRRLLVIEREIYFKAPDDLGLPPRTGSSIAEVPNIGGRIVYMETLDV